MTSTPWTGLRGHQPRPLGEGRGLLSARRRLTVERVGRAHLSRPALVASSDVGEPHVSPVGPGHNGAVPG